jgi:uncharacterized lipoprotein YmbA
MIFRIGIVGAALLLAACGSSPKTHYFTLDTVPPPQGEKAPLSSPVTVAEVQVPPSLDRREMVRRTGANTADVSGEDRWTAPLGDMVRNVLSQDLAARLPEGKVILPDSPAPPHTSDIVLSIARFDADPSGKVTLDGSWSLVQERRGRPVLQRDVALETSAAAPGPDGQAAAMSRLLGQLATQIATTLAERDAAERRGAASGSSAERR